MWYTRLQLFAECVYTRLKLRKPAYTRVHLVQLAYIRFCNPEKRRIWSLSRKIKKHRLKTGKAWIQENIRQSEPINRGAEPRLAWGLPKLGTTRMLSPAESPILVEGKVPLGSFGLRLYQTENCYFKETHTQPSSLLLSKSLRFRAHTYGPTLEKTVRVQTLLGVPFFFLWPARQTNQRTQQYLYKYLCINHLHAIKLVIKDL